MKGKRHRIVSFRLALAPLLAGLTPVFALAQSGEGIEAPETDGWKFSVGLGAISKPRFPGSDQRKTEALPLLSAAYGRYFIGGLPGGGGVPFGLGALLVRDPRWQLGVAVGGEIDKARKSSDDPRLRGLADIDGTARATVFGSFTQDWLSLRANVSTDIGGNHQGTLATLELEGQWHATDRLTLTAGPGIRWADRKYTETFFGVTADQSARSGLAAYTAGSGVDTLRFTVGADYELTPRWKLGTRITAARLRGDAVDSPITVSKAQNLYAGFVAYRF